MKKILIVSNDPNLSISTPGVLVRTSSELSSPPKAPHVNYIGNRQAGVIGVVRQYPDSEVDAIFVEHRWGYISSKTLVIGIYHPSELCFVLPEELL